MWDLCGGQAREISLRSLMNCTVDGCSSFKLLLLIPAN
ncbi:rCG45257 [Rattus norvegicus]|uniref:RCG45257 n=1 Tax=Rattus norvegicus TaxID=10116 RepID=A6KLH2_RAT|nr:rCG45257 [Rattus norvegicus]